MSLRLDHLRLLDDQRYFQRSSRRLRASLKAGQVLQAAMLHEADDSCCRRESYMTTVARLTEIAPEDSIYMQVGQRQA